MAKRKRKTINTSVIVAIVIGISLMICSGVYAYVKHQELEFEKEQFNFSQLKKAEKEKVEELAGQKEEEKEGIEKEIVADNLDLCLEKAGEEANIKLKTDLSLIKGKVSAFSEFALTQGFNSEEVNASSILGEESLKAKAWEGYRKYLSELKNECFRRYP